MEFRKYLKIHQLGHEENIFIFNNPEEEIVVEEKIDGANFRFYINEFGEIIFGSRSQQLSESKEHKFAKNFERCIRHIKEKLYGKDLMKYRGMIFYGEDCIKHSMGYDWEKMPSYLGFDINNDENPDYPRRYIPFPLVKDIFEELDLDFVPVIKICKAKDISKIDESMVPISEYAILSGAEDNRKAEGIIFKKYRFNENNNDDGQIFAKYVRDKFKEINAEAFGTRKANKTQDDTGEVIFKYCTNARIDKIVFKLLDEGNKLDMTLMHLLPKRVQQDIFEEHSKEIFESNYSIDFRKFRQLVPKRCVIVLKQILVNNSLK